MASMGGSHLDPEPLCRAIKGPAFLNKVLQAICVAEGLSKHGVKAELQSRLSDKIRLYARTNNATAFNRIKGMIEDPGRFLQNPRSSLTASPAASSPLGAGNPYYGNAMPPANPSYRPGPGFHIEFKPSPFYKPKGQLGPTKPCDSENDCAHISRSMKFADREEAMAQHRHTVEIQVSVISNPLLEECTRDKSLRVMVFCAGEPGPQRQDVAFPHQSELKVNTGDVKANLRGLKNKPGSTRPVDITDLLRLKPTTYMNTISMTYALTTKKFWLSVWVVKNTPVVDLVQALSAGQKISKEAVLREMVAKASDPDIETTSSVLSLKCPLSTLRIDLPCRSIRCRHNQCFDATSYLQLQEQGPTWLCPICNNSAPFDSLAVDEYLKDILKSTSRSIDQVTVEPTGKWSTSVKAETPNHHKPTMAFGSDDDDDLIEISDDRVTQLRVGTNSTPQSASGTRTPEAFQREQSNASITRRPSNKRPIQEVVDLTLSDDDEEPVRPVKRQQTSSGSFYSTPYGANQYGGL